MNKRTDILNLVVALVLSTAILVGWQYAYEMPRQKEAQRIALLKQKEKKAQEKQVQAEAPAESKKTRAELLAESPRVKLRSNHLHGSLALKGLRFDDLTLARYHEALDKNSPEVVLLSPGGEAQTYFAEIGWLASGDASVRVPDKETLWQADADTLTPQTPVTLKWDNGAGLLFSAKISLDDNYMVSVQQQVSNASGKPVTLQPYAFINRAYTKDHPENAILHEGPLGVMGGTLQEFTYYDLASEQQEHLFEGTHGWVGITDKYWLTALVPGEGTVNARFSYYASKGQDRYQTDFQYAPTEIATGATGSVTTRLFAGAKEVRVLDAYAKQYDIPLFDRAVDFGYLYFLTKPLSLVLLYFYSHLGNFGLAIMLLTVFIKLLMYPLANKSYVSMNEMKRLTPDVMRLRETHGEDKMRMNQEIMALYRKEKVNPASGCVPMLLQIPVFFALYKVFYVSIEMRHAPFYGWVHDLSVPDPTNIFTLFGLLPWDAPSLLHIGVLPILMCLTMVIQQKLNPPPPDPTQAKVFAILPYVFLFLFASFPAGLVLYWVWSNILSIAQQKMIATRYQKKYTGKS